MGTERACESVGCRLKRCDVESCEAMCCYDGAYLLPGEERLIREAMAYAPADFRDVPEDCIVDGYWRGRHLGRKTAVKSHTYTAADYPSHFAATRCVFADERGYCRLQRLGQRLGIHPWTFKPAACWLFPLKIAGTKPVAPPTTHEADPDRDASYPGFTTFARCGRHQENGQPWHETLAEELRYFRTAKAVPVWANRGLSVAEIIEAQMGPRNARNDTK